MKTRKLLLAIVSVLCVVLMAGSVISFAEEAAASDLAAIQEKGTLVVGITDFAPMDYKDEDGNWIGFDADLARIFAAALDVEVEFQEIEWDNKILELDSGAIDCVWNGMTLTPEVADAMDCTITYALNAQVVVMAKDALEKYADVESMKDLFFAVEAGSAGEEVGVEAGLEVNPVTSQAAALMEVAAGTSDACIIDMTMAAAMTGEGTSYENLGYAVVLSSEDYVVGFRKGSELKEIADALIAVMIVSGEMQELSAAYDNAVSIAELPEELVAELASEIEAIMAEDGEAEAPEETEAPAAN